MALLQPEDCYVSDVGPASEDKEADPTDLEPDSHPDAVLSHAPVEKPT